jgi:nitrate/nitrite transporter NarK
MGFRSAAGSAVGATFVTLGLVYGVWYAYSVLLVALLHDFGWSRSLLAGGSSVFVLVGHLSPGLGWLVDRIGSRRLVLAGGAVLANALALDGAVQSPGHAYLAFGVVTAVGAAPAGWVPTVILVQGWYPRHVGLALGVHAAFLVDHSIVPLVAASVVTLVGLASIVGKADGGWFSDRFGREVTHAIGMACVVASVAMLGLVALHPGLAPALP